MLNYLFNVHTIVLYFKVNEEKTLRTIRIESATSLLLNVDLKIYLITTIIYGRLRINTKRSSSRFKTGYSIYFLNDCQCICHLTYISIYALKLIKLSKRLSPK